MPTPADQRAHVSSCGAPRRYGAVFFFIVWGVGAIFFSQFGVRAVIHSHCDSQQIHSTGHLAGDSAGRSLNGNVVILARSGAFWRG